MKNNKWKTQNYCFDISSIKITKGWKPKNRQCFITSWNVLISLCDLLHFSLAFTFCVSPTGHSGSPLNTARPGTGVRQSPPCTGCWCCSRCCTGTCRLLGLGERDPPRRWTPCWSVPPRASTSLGWRRSASWWTLATGRNLKFLKSYLIWVIYSRS